MKYALLVYTDPSDWAALSEEAAAAARAASLPRWYALFEELGKADPNATGFELTEGAEARVVRVRDGERIVTDGPFAETKELIGGVFLLDVRDLDEAIRLASLVPAAEYGSLEIRPIVDHSASEAAA